jgi:hypothetical protein
MDKYLGKGCERVACGLRIHLDVGGSSHTKEQKTNANWDLIGKERLGNDKELCRFGSLFTLG